MDAFAWDKWILLEAFLLDFFFQNCLGSISLITHYTCISWSVPTVCDFLPWFSNSGDTQISVYIHVTSISKSIWDNQCYFWPGFNVHVQPVQCFLQSPLFCETAIIWNLHQVVSIFFQFLFRGLNIKLKVKLTFWTAFSSHQVVEMSLTKGWVMENIPRWIWSFSCNRLAENKMKWAGHGLNTCIKTTIKVCFLEKKKLIWYQ